MELSSLVVVDVITVIIKVASEVFFKSVTDDIMSKVMKKTTVSKMVQERLDCFSEASRVYCVWNGSQWREYFWRMSSVKFFTKSLIFVFLALGRKIPHNTKHQSERSDFIMFCKGFL